MSRVGRDYMELSLVASVLGAYLVESEEAVLTLQDTLIP